MSIVATKSFGGNKDCCVSTSTFDTGYGTIALSFPPLSNIHHPSPITYENSKNTPKIRSEHREPLCAKATVTNMPSAATSNGLNLCKNASSSPKAGMPALVTLQLSAR